MIQELLKNVHIIKGKKVDCKLAIPKEKIENISSSKKKKKKIKRSSSVSLLNKTKSKKVNKEIIVNNPKSGIKAYEEITNRPSNYTKYLFEKYKDVVDNYEKEKINSKNNSVTKLIKKKK